MIIISLFGNRVLLLAIGSITGFYIHQALHWYYRDTFIISSDTSSYRTPSIITDVLHKVIEGYRIWVEASDFCGSIVYERIPHKTNKTHVCTFYYDLIHTLIDLDWAPGERDNSWFYSFIYTVCEWFEHWSYCWRQWWYHILILI